MTPASTPPSPSRRLRRSLATAAVLTGLAAVSGCGVTFGAPSGTSGGGDERILTVLAASSLQPSFDRLGKTFESEHKGVTVKLVYASSATLAQRTIRGAPGGVLATADRQAMQQAEAGGGTSGTPTEFASDSYYVAVTKDARHRALALDWVVLLISPAGQKILAAQGLSPS